MTHRFRSTLPFLALAAVTTTVGAERLAAQAPARPFTLAGFGGGVSSLRGGDESFRVTHEDGVRLGYDVSSVISLRAVVTRAMRETSGAAWGKNAGTDVAHWRYAAEVVVGPSGALNVRPYAFGGAGLETSTPRGGDGNASAAARAGLGVEWRPGRSRIGAALEAGANAYRLNTLGVRHTQYDLAWNGGLSLHW
jgi:hypothetical protein